MPKVRDRSGGRFRFNSNLTPPYLRRVKNIEELLLWLYLKGNSTGDVSEALEALLGPQARGLSTATIDASAKSPCSGFPASIAVYNSLIILASEF